MIPVSFSRCRLEVADADGAGSLLLVEADQGAPGFHVIVEARSGPVDQVEVHIIGAQFFEALVECPERIVKAVLRVPEFRGDKEILSLPAARGDSLSHVLLVPVNGSRIDVDVAGVERRVHRTDQFLFVLHLPDAQTEARHLHAVAQRVGAFEILQHI